VEKVLIALFITGHEDTLQWRLLRYSISTVIACDATADLHRSAGAPAASRGHAAEIAKSK
jgi:hypothetical protein